MSDKKEELFPDPVINDITDCLDGLVEGSTFLKISPEQTFEAASGVEIRAFFQLAEWKAYGLKERSGWKCVGALIPHGKVDVFEVFMTNLQESDYLGTIKVFSVKNEAERDDSRFLERLAEIVIPKLFIPAFSPFAKRDED